MTTGEKFNLEPGKWKQKKGEKGEMRELTVQCLVGMFSEEALQKEAQAWEQFVDEIVDNGNSAGKFH